MGSSPALFRHASRPAVQPLAGGAPRRLTDFKTDRIFRYAWSRDGKHLACSRGVETNDVVLISDLR